MAEMTTIRKSDRTKPMKRKRVLTEARRKQNRESQKRFRTSIALKSPVGCFTSSSMGILMFTLLEGLTCCRSTQESEAF